MRPARGGVGPSIRPRLGPVVQNFYEDFKPMSEWRQDEESDILSLFLPGMSSTIGQGLHCGQLHKFVLSFSFLVNYLCIHSTSGFRCISYIYT